MLKRTLIFLTIGLGALFVLFSLKNLSDKPFETLPERPPTFDELMNLADKNLAPNALIQSYINGQAEGGGFQKVLEHAKTGNVTAEVMACYLLIAGIGVEQNESLGYSLCEKAAEKGAGTAKSNLIYRDFSADSSDASWQKAHAAFNNLLDLDPGVAHRGLQHLYRQGGPNFSLPKVYYHSEQAVQHQNTSAMILLSNIDLGRYPYGQPNLVRAEKNLIKAYELNDFDAGFVLALEYRNGNRLPQDIEKYVTMIKRMARFLHADSISELGFMHQTGEGAALNQDKANEYFRQAAKFGNRYAQKMIAHELLFGPMNVRDHEKGVEYLEYQAENGDVQSMITLADHYARSEISDSKNLQFVWLSQAAMYGDSGAQEILGFSMMETGYMEAIQPYIQALEQAHQAGHADASYLLARHYRAASGVRRDLRKAKLILNKVRHLDDPRVKDEIEIIESYVSYFGGIDKVPAIIKR